MNSERVVWRRRSMPQHRQPQENPLFPKPKPARWRIFVVAGLFLFLLLAIPAIGVFSPLFRLDYILIDGNRYIQRDVIEQAVTRFADERILWVFPKRSFFLFSNDSAKKSLLARLQSDQAIESLTVLKRFPATVMITLTERTPNAAYSNGGKMFLVDRDGIIAAVPQEEKKIDPDFPLVYDQTTRLLDIGGRAMDPSMISFLFSLQTELKNHTDIPAAFYYLPPVSCAQQATIAEPEPEQQPTDEETRSNTNNNLNSNSANLNVNKKISNSNVSLQNRSITNTNTPNRSNVNAVTNASVGETPCELETLVLANRELRVKTTEGWEIYFRSDQLTIDQVTRLIRVLREQKLDRAKLKYVDLRFGEQVIIR